MKVGIRFFNGQTDWEWVQKLNPILRVEDTGGMVAFDEETGELQAACIWDNWTPNSVQCHMYSINTKVVTEANFIHETFDYLFNYRDIKLIYGLLCEDNKKALRLAGILGFTENSRIEGGWNDTTDLVMVVLKKDDCSYLPTKESKDG